MIVAAVADLCPVVTIKAIGPYHTASQLAANLPQAPKAMQGSNRGTSAQPLGPVDTTKVTEASARMAAQHPLLWQGEWQSILKIDRSRCYESQSQADLALAGHIARHLSGKGIAAASLALNVEAVFSRSALGARDKWTSRADYRESTIRTASASISATAAPVSEALPIDWGIEGDVRNARAFANMWRGRLAWLPSCNRWMKWGEDIRWRFCEQGEEVECAKAVCARLLADAAAVMAQDADKARRLIREATEAHKLPRIKAMLELARSEAGMLVPASLLDAEPHLLGVTNGIVDLRRGHLLFNQPDYYVTRFCAAAFEASAQCPRWLQFLDEVFEADADTIASVQRMLGYSLVGSGTEEIMIFCVGYGANGKSIFGNVVNALMGDYARSAPSSTLASRRPDDHGPRGDLAMLDGARLLSINELPAGLQLDEQVVKQLAGREAITARHLYGNYFTYKPRFTPWVRTNHRPIIKGDDDGIWRRIVVLPFRRKFEEHERDPRLEDTLLRERDGILGWMIAGAQLYLKGGLSLSKAIRAEQAGYRKESDLLGEYLEECTGIQPGAKVEQSALYISWEVWCRQNGAQAGSKKSFTQRLAERGHAAAKSNGTRYYQGLTLPPPFGTGRRGQV